LSLEDEAELIEKVDIIFHCAAVIKFNEKLKDAINCNTLGTLRLLKLGEKMVRLQVFTYMSTIYSHTYEPELHERYYPSGLDVMDVIKMTNELPNDKLDDIEKEL